MIDYFVHECIIKTNCSRLVYKDQRKEVHNIYMGNHNSIVFQCI